MPPRLHRLGLTEAGVGNSPSTKPLPRASKRRPRAANEAFRDRTIPARLSVFAPHQLVTHAKRCKLSREGHKYTPPTPRQRLLHRNSGQFALISHTSECSPQHTRFDATQMKLYLLAAAAHALKAPTRRSLLAAVPALVAPLTKAEPALAVNDELVDVYFGCGCF